MIDAARPRRVRSAALGVGSLAATAVHVATRYVFATLSGFGTYRGLDPVVPWLFLGAYLLALAALAAVAVARRGRDGAVLAAGLLVLAAEPIASGFRFGDGCDAGAGTGATLLPDVTTNGVAVVLGAWDGACSASITPVVVALGALVVGLGLRRVAGELRIGGGPVDAGSHY